MKITALSDLHGFLIDVPKCDVLVICGDICPADSHSLKFQDEWIKTKFVDWLNKADCKHVVFIPGNHDLVFERKYKKDTDIYDVTSLVNKPCHCLINRGVTIYGHTFFGTPYCKRFGHWAFMRDDYTLCEKYAEIPEDVDILLTHDAPLIGGLGTIRDRRPVEEAGNPTLAYYIELKKPKYVFCGHIHSGNHNMVELDNTKLYNVSICNELYNPVNKPVEIEV